MSCTCSIITFIIRALCIFINVYLITLRTVLKSFCHGKQQHFILPLKYYGYATERPLHLWKCILQIHLAKGHITKNWITYSQCWQMWNARFAVCLEVDADVLGEIWERWMLRVEVAFSEIERWQKETMLHCRAVLSIENWRLTRIERCISTDFDLLIIRITTRQWRHIW